MIEKTRIIFLLNPISGTRSRLDIPGLIQEYINRDRFAVELTYTEYAGHATSLARQAARDGVAVVVAVGGDGTVNEVARGLLGTQAVLGIVPRGSGNGLARHLGIPLRVGKALEVINQMQISQIDSGTINGHPFFCTAGLGFDAHISSVFATNKQRGFRSYMKLILQEFHAFAPQKVRITFPGKSMLAECFVVAFGNAAQYGNNAFIAPMADIRDGLLDMCVVPRLGLAEAMEIGVRLLTKQLASSGHATFYKAEEIQVEAQEEVMFHADGDFVGTARDFEVKVFPLSLRVIIPA